MKISDLSKRTGLSTKTIRYYESIGLLQQAKRADNGYRHYGEQDVHTLQFVLRAKDLGFSLEECAELLKLYEDPHRASAEVKQLAQARILELDRQIQNLQAMRDALGELIRHCHGDGNPQCAIIDSLDATESGRH
ncbi:transcriptional regulator [Pokkaliibacter plantistimulans]|uniref:Transcriptional regulator n=1 Tax=Pokkaliibacter plantistimulans TaxID=1635171 RepID=A0ABX5LW53_9GAMM|nr:Cu(I)-responsive transcriptional regulator [Pokkaliibacter plantistimulans]PXF29526.1 transcriptional regulator [Pokkaliibacter plantistimulans]